METVGIYVFSGTGNTLRCAEALRDALAELGRGAALRMIRDGSEKASEGDLVVCYPVYGFNAPTPVLRFCRGQETREGGRVWFLKTSGEPLRLNDASSAELARPLRRKGYEIAGEFGYVMPYNILFRHSDEAASLMWETAKRRIPAAARMIAAGEGAAPRPGAGAKLMSALCRIEHGFYPLNGRLFRVDKSKCLRCMKCVEACPVGNIKYKDGRFSFGGKCACCTRCAFSCPADAIHIGIIDFMRVNGPYDFARDPAKAGPIRYCRRAYERYFSGQ